MAEQKVITIHAREALYVKQRDLPHKAQQRLVDKFRFRFYEEKACKACDVYDERLATEGKHLDVCDSCSAYKGGAELSSPEEIGGTPYIKCPVGNPRELISVLQHQGFEYKIKKHFPDVPFKRSIKFTGTLREHQPKGVDAIVDKKRGVLKSPPRSGKTVMGSAAICRIGKKALIMASQIEWLEGFQETFVGSDTQKPLTNCRQSQIGLCKTLEDFKRYDVCLVTVQSFYSKGGRRLLRKIRSMFSVLMVDEVHKGAAPEYATVIAALNCEWKIGLSGTPSRKDGRFVLMRNLLGPVIADIKVKMLRPRIRLVRTKYNQQFKGQTMWARIVSSLERDPGRLRLIAEWAIQDVRNGHMVLIPFAHVIPIKALVQAINKLAGSEIAFPFYGGVRKDKRKLYLQMARQYKAKVLVGNTGLLSTGTNIPRASALYETTLSSNEENAEQRFSRVLTPYDDKPQPIVRYFLDNSNVRKNCMRNEWYRVMLPKFKPLMSEPDKQVMKSYLSSKRDEQPERMTF